MQMGKSHLVHVVRVQKYIELNSLYVPLAQMHLIMSYGILSIYIPKYELKEVTHWLTQSTREFRLNHGVMADSTVSIHGAGQIKNAKHISMSIPYILNAQVKVSRETDRQTRTYTRFSGDLIRRTWPANVC